MRVGFSLAPATATATALGLAGCKEIQSALSPQGAEAAEVAILFWIMFWIGAAILLGVMILAGVAIFGGERWRDPLRSEWIVIGGGVVFPIVLLSALLVTGLLITGAESSSRAGAASLRIAVVAVGPIPGRTPTSVPSRTPRKQ